MSLFSAMQLAGNALSAQQIGLEVVGQNIANANTPGYSRSEVVLTPAPTQKHGRLLLGMGVEVDAVVQRIDRLLEQRLRYATGDRVGSEMREQIYAQLEGIIGELNKTDLSSSMNAFFGSVEEILNQPESTAVRNLAILQGEILAGDITRMAERVTQVQIDVNRQITDMAKDINRLLGEIANLNVRISAAEGGSVSKSDAVGLRDQRHVALAQLAELVDIRADEQPSGAVNIYLGGDFLVFEGMHRTVGAVLESEGRYAKATLKIVDIDSSLRATSGKLAGLYAARDEILGGFLTELDQFAATLAFEFNKVYSSGQGLKGYTTLTSEFAPTNATVPLNQAGLTFTPKSGAFQVMVYSTQTGLSRSTQINIDLNGLDGNDTTLESLRAALDEVDGITATLDPQGRLVLASESPDVEFAFADDSSGILAALGVNTFFTGTSARNLGVNAALAADPALFAASRGGIDADSENAAALAGFRERPIGGPSGPTIVARYELMVGTVAQNSAVSHSVAEGYRVFEETLLGQSLAISGVNIDEETVRMISYQRAYQAAARFITEVSKLLDVLVNI